MILREFGKMTSIKDEQCKHPPDEANENIWRLVPNINRNEVHFLLMLLYVPLAYSYSFAKSFVLLFLHKHIRFGKQP